MAKECKSNEPNEMEKRMKKCIDNMYKYFPYYSVSVSRRTKLTGQSCICKKMFENDMNKTCVISEWKINENTRLEVRCVNQKSSRKWIVEEALDNIKRKNGQPLNKERFEKVLKKGRHLNVDTSHLGCDAKIIEKKEEILEKEYEIKITKILKENISEKTLNYLKEEDIEINELQKFISKIKLQLKEFEDKCKKYLLNYNKLKELYIKYEKENEGSYQYRNVIISYENKTSSSTYINRVRETLKKHDFKRETEYLNSFDSKMKEICLREKLYTLQYLLDSKDFTNFVQF